MEQGDIRGKVLRLHPETMTEDELLELLSAYFEIIKGCHVEFPNGYHTDTPLLRCLIQSPPDMAALGSELSAKFPLPVKGRRSVDAVLGNTDDIGVSVADRIAADLRIRTVLASDFRLFNPSGIRRGFELNAGERVILVTDFDPPPCKKIQCLAEIARAQRAEIYGIGLYASLDPENLEVLRSISPNVHVLAEFNLPYSKQPPEDCPACQGGIPLTFVKAYS